MRISFALLLFFLFANGLAAQYLPIPKKGKVLANFGEQIITYSKKKKSITFHYRNNLGAVQSKSVDYSDVPLLKIVMKKYAYPITEPVYNPEIALEKFKIYNDGNFIYATMEKTERQLHFTELAALDLKTKEFTIEKIYSTPKEVIGFSDRTKGTSCIYDGKIFQTSYNAMTYGISVHDLSDKIEPKYFYNTIKDSITYKNSDISYLRDLVGINVYTYSWNMEKILDEFSLYRKLEKDLPFICVAKDSTNYIISVGSFSRQEYDSFLIPNNLTVINILEAHKSNDRRQRKSGWKALFENYGNYSNTSLSFVSILNSLDFEHVSVNKKVTSKNKKE